METTNTPEVRLDIVNLIERNPIARFNRDYQNKFIHKIQEKFTNSEQQMFIGSFYCYLNYNKHDFIIDMENVWKWLGFSRKDPCKLVLTKNFTRDVDYIITSATYGAPQRPKKGGGQNKETILMNITTFKKLCLKADTKKADEIHDYFIKLEETLQEVINEESNELRNQLQIQLRETETQLQNQRLQSEKEKEALRERTIIEHFPENTQCVYYGAIDNKTQTGESLFKFGNSNTLKKRVEDHKKTFDNFRLLNAFKVENKFQIENEIKKHPILKMMRRNLSIQGQNQTELLIHNMPVEEIDKMIQEIIIKIEFSPENYKKILEENETLKRDIETLKKENKTLQEIIKRKPAVVPSLQTPNETLTIALPDTVFNYETQRLRRLNKAADGLYHIGEKTFRKLVGTREEVWNDQVYKTSGNLTKDDLCIGKDGRIVSKTKNETGKTDSQLQRFANANAS
jgi:hypothetical protein